MELRSQLLLKLLTWTALVQNVVNAFSRFDVTAVCNTMHPGHVGLGAQTSPPPYGIHITPEDDGSYLVTVYGKHEEKFKGFLLQARDPSDRRVGLFSSSQTKGKIIECDNVKSAVQHRNSDDKTQVTARWIPGDYKGPLHFRATVVKSYFQYWLGIESQELTV